MIKHLCLLVLLIGFLTQVEAQYIPPGANDEEKEKDTTKKEKKEPKSPKESGDNTGKKGFQWKKVFYGGSISPSFSNNFIYVGASPIIGYRFTPRFALGAGGTYIFSKNTASGNSNHTYGVRGLGRFLFYEQWFFQAEYQKINREINRETNERAWGKDRLFLGGGVETPIGQNSYFSLTFMYNVLHEDDSFGNRWEIRPSFWF